MEVDTSKCWCCKKPLKTDQRGRDYYCKACGIYLPWSWYREAITAKEYDKEIEWEWRIRDARPDYTSPLIAYQVARNQIDMQAAQSRCLQADTDTATQIRQIQTLDALQANSLISAEEYLQRLPRSYVYCGRIDPETDF